MVHILYTFQHRDKISMISYRLIATLLISGELIVSKYVAESITMIAGRFGHEGLCQLRTELKKLQCEISLVTYAPTLHHTTPLASLLYNLSHTAVSLVLYAVDKGLRGRNVLQSLLLILLRICSRSVRPIRLV